MPHTGVMSRITSVFKLSRSEGAHLNDMKYGRYPSLDLEEKLGLEAYFPVGHQPIPEGVFWNGFVYENSLTEMRTSTSISLSYEHRVSVSKAATFTHKNIWS